MDTIEEALAQANEVEFGLSDSVYTKDIGTMMSFINNIDAGLVRINAEYAAVEQQAPFSGMKQSSSHSRELGDSDRILYSDQNRFCKIIDRLIL